MCHDFFEFSSLRLMQDFYMEKIETLIPRFVDRIFKVIQILYAVRDVWDVKDRMIKAIVEANFRSSTKLLMEMKMR